MTPQERQLVDELFDRLSQVESAPRDPDASNAIAQGSRKAPNAVYTLVQTVLLQDEALKRANHRIQELEQAHAGEQNQSGGFLDSMRDTILGQNQSRGSVPNVPPPVPSRPVWNSGQVLQQSQSPGHYDQGPYDQGPYGQGSYGQGSYGQGYGQGPSGQPYGASQSPFGGGGGSFLGTAAAAAAGMVGGSLLLNSIRSMMGGHIMASPMPARPATGLQIPRAINPTARWRAMPGSMTSGLPASAALATMVRARGSSIRHRMTMTTRITIRTGLTATTVTAITPDLLQFAKKKRPPDGAAVLICALAMIR